MIVVADESFGNSIWVKGVLSIMDARFHFYEHSNGGGWGNAQRDFGITKASKDFLMFVDDDDMYWPGALSTVVHPALASQPDCPHMFRITGGPHADKIELHHVAGAGFVPPNDPTKLARWNRVDCRAVWCDFYFIRDTMKYYDDVFINHPEEVYIYRPEKDSSWNTGVPKSIIARIA